MFLRTQSTGLHRLTDVRFRKILVTGGAGFIGSHLIEELATYRAQLVVLDNLSSGFESNIGNSVRLVKGDIRTPAQLKAAAMNADVVFHFAEYIPNVEGHVIRSSGKNPTQDAQICVEGTLNVLEECRRNDSSFVLASTAAVYGSSEDPVREDSIQDPISVYGVSKLCAERYSLLYAKSYGIPVVIVRFFNVYGPRQRKYLMYDFLSKVRKTPRKVELLGTGSEVRDYIYVKDAVNILLSLVASQQHETLPIFNIGTGEGHTTGEIISQLEHIAGVNPALSYSGRVWPGTSRSLVADMTKTRRYSEPARKSLAEGMDALVSWFNDISKGTRRNPLASRNPLN